MHLSIHRSIDVSVCLIVITSRVVCLAQSFYHIMTLFVHFPALHCSPSYFCKFVQFLASHESELIWGFAEWGSELMSLSTFNFNLIGSILCIQEQFSPATRPSTPSLSPALRDTTFSEKYSPSPVLSNPSRISSLSDYQTFTTPLTLPHLSPRLFPQYCFKPTFNASQPPPSTVLLPNSPLFPI